MPRHIDPELEARIVKAARKLWSKGGEKALSMRSIAAIAQTNTPAVYRRFRNRDAILRALVESYQRELFEAVEPCRSLEAVAESVPNFAATSPFHRLSPEGDNFRRARAVPWPPDNVRGCDRVKPWACANTSS